MHDTFTFARVFDDLLMLDPWANGDRKGEAQEETGAAKFQKRQGLGGLNLV